MSLYIGRLKQLNVTTIWIHNMFREIEMWLFIDKQLNALSNKEDNKNKLDKYRMFYFELRWYYESSFKSYFGSSR